MYETLLLIVVIEIGVLLLLGILAIIYFLRILKESAKSFKDKEFKIIINNSIGRSTDSYNYNNGNKDRPEIKADMIPPEIMAPALKKPPKSAGGFGTKVKD